MNHVTFWMRRHSLAGLLAAVFAALGVGNAARADLVTARLAYTGASGASLQATMGGEGIYLDGASGDETGTFSLSLDETFIIQLTGQGVSDFKIIFSPPPQYSMVIEGERQMGYSSSSPGPGTVSKPLRVTMVRRERPPAADTALGQASPIAWHAPKTQGLMGPYLNFDVGRALNGESLPPLRIPLFPRGTTSDPIALDLPDCGYVPASGGFELTAPQVTVRLELDSGTPGYFWLRFYVPGGAIFAAYHFEFPTWPGGWSSSRQARVVNDKTASGSAENYETSITGFWAINGMVQTSPYNTWTIEDWHVQAQSPLRTLLGRRDVTYGSGGSFGQWFLATTITDTVEVRKNASDAMVAKQSYSYKEFDRWLTEDPNDGIQIAIAAHESIEGVGDGNYIARTLQDPRAPTITGSDGTGGFRQLADASNNAKTVYETWLDNSPGFDPAGAWGYQIAVNGATQTTIDYELDPRWFDFQLPKNIVRKLGTRTLANTTITYAEQTVDNRGTSATDDDLNVIIATRKDYASGGASDYVESVVKKYRPDAPVATLRERPYSIQSPGGSKQSFSYEITGSELRVTILSGATSGGYEVTGLSNTVPVDALRMIPNRSTKTVEVYQRGQLTRRETWVFISGSGASPVFNSTAAVAWENFAYTPDGRLQLRTSSNNTRYEANWAGRRKNWQADETGLKTNFGYDDMDRVTAIVRESAVGMVEQATTFKYDANHRLRYQQAGPVDFSKQPTGEQIVTEMRYDLGGRLKKRIAAGGATDGSSLATGIVTDYNYANGDRDVTETLPSGTRATARYADGRLKLINGSAVATQESYEYSFDGSDRRQTTISFSTEANKRPRIIVVDWLGRVVEERVNGVLQNDGSSKPIVTTNVYGNRGLLDSTKVAEMTGATALYLSADRLLEYDEFGALKNVGLNVDGAGGLQEASTDRFTSSETRFFQDGAGTWWLLATTKLFHTDNSGSFLTGSRYTRLTGFAAGKTAQIDSYDFRNNRTSEEVSFGTKTRAVTALAVDGTKVVTTTVGGLTTTVQAVNDAAAETQTTSYVYDAQGRLQQVTDPRSVVTRHVYHSGTTQVWKTFEGSNEASQEIRVAMLAYDAAGRVSSNTDAKGSVATTTYYPTGQVMDRTGSAIHPVHYVYDAFGQQKELWSYRNGTGALADKTIWEYDANTGWLKAKKDAANRSVSYSYSYSSPYKTITRTSPRPGLTTTYKYRLATGELAAVDYSDGTPDVGYTYTRTGQIDTVTEGAITNNAVFPISFAAGARFRDFSYDREQLSAEALDSAWYGGLVLTTLFDDATAQSPASNLVPGRYAGFALGYVPVVNGVPQTQDMAKEMKVAMGYDDFGRPASFAVSHANQASASFAYDYTPNSSFWRRVTRGNYSQERTPETARDVLKTVTAKWGTTTLASHVYTTNDAGEQSSVVQRGTAFADYGDDNGATAVVYGYNSVGELEAATGYLGTGTSQPLPGRGYSFTYDTAGNRKTAAVGTESVNYTDGAGGPGGNNLNQVRQRGTLKTRVSGTAHQDASVSVPGGTVSRITGTRYWDAVLASWGQYTQVNLSATRNGVTQNGSVWALTRPSSESFSYDEEGNLTDDGLWHYEYDAENRLVRMATKSAGDLAGLGWGSTPPSRELTFQYDYLGRRTEKIARKNGAVTFSRRFVYEGWNLIAEFELASGVPNVRRSFAWGLDVASGLTAAGGVGALILETVHNGSSRTHYSVASDGQGSVTALVDANGAPIAAYEYDPFGQSLRAEGAVAGDNPASMDQPGDNPFRYSSKYLDRETGLYYYGRRYYDPSLGRFINRDPIGEEGGENLYAFVGNCPVGRWDYLGMSDADGRPRVDNGPYGPTPETPGEDGSYRSRNRVDIRDNADFPANWGTDAPNSGTWWRRVLTSLGEAEIRRAENEVMAARAGLELLGIVVENWRRRFYNAALQAEIERVGPDGQIDYLAVQMQAEVMMLVSGEVFALPQIGAVGTLGAGSVVFRQPGGLTINVVRGANGELQSVTAVLKPQYLKTGTGTTEAARDVARALGQATDDAGHAIAKVHGGGGGAGSGNIFPQAASVNRGAFREFEKEITTALRAGKQVHVEQVFRGGARPTEVVYKITIDGKTTTRVFPNP